MSEARIIAVVAQKGGAGKTTVTMGLAGTLASRGHRVAVVDMDPQQTAVRWSKSAAEGRPFKAIVMPWHVYDISVGREVKKILGNYDFILVDCPPSVASNVPKAVLAFADLALIPTRPSGPDVWASAAMADVVRDVRVIRGDDLPARIVPNQVVERTQVAKVALGQLKQSEIPVTSTMLATRTAYQQAAILGMALEDIEIGAIEAAREMSSLADEVLVALAGAHESPSQARTA